MKVSKRNHKALFDRNLPFRPKKECLNNKYRRNQKHKKKIDTE